MSQPLNEPQSWGILGLRLALAAIVGLHVVFLSLLAVWWDTRNAISVRMEQFETKQRLKWIAAEIESYRHDPGAIPKSLSELAEHGLGAVIASNKWLVDGWRRPFIYTVNGTNWTVLSYGHDGQPGGTGADADLTNWKPEPAESKVLPSFREFVFEAKMTRGATITSIVSGVLATSVSLLTVRIPRLTRRGMLKVALTVLATVVGAAFAAAFIGSLHVPTH